MSADDTLLDSLRAMQPTLDELIAKAPKKTAAQKKARLAVIAERDRLMMTCDTIVTRRFSATAVELADAQAQVTALAAKLDATKATLTHLAAAVGIVGDVLSVVARVVAFAL